MAATVNLHLHLPEHIMTPVAFHHDRQRLQSITGAQSKAGQVQQLEQDVC